MEPLASTGSSSHDMDVKEPDQAVGAAGEPAPEPADADGPLETQVESPVDLLLGCCVDSHRADGASQQEVADSLLSPGFGNGFADCWCALKVDPGGGGVRKCQNEHEVQGEGLHLLAS